MSQAKLIVLLGATSDLILTRQNSLKRNLSIHMQLTTKSMCPWQSRFDLRGRLWCEVFFKPLLLSTVLTRRKTTAPIFSTPALIRIISPTKLNQAVSSIIQRAHTWLNQLPSKPYLRVQHSQIETDGYWRTLASSTTSSAREKLCLIAVNEQRFCSNQFWLEKFNWDFSKSNFYCDSSVLPQDEFYLKQLHLCLVLRWDIRSK